MPRKSQYACLADALAPKPPAHDAVVVLVADHVCELLDRMHVLDHEYRDGPDGKYLVSESILNLTGGHVSYELEYEISPTDYVDIAVLVQGRLCHMFEIKSAAEPQTASGWTRQVRRYAKRAGVPCTLLVAHDLSADMQNYFARAETPWLDVRALSALTR